MVVVKPLVASPPPPPSNAGAFPAKKAVYLFDYGGTLLCVFAGVHEAALDLRCPPATVRCSLRRGSRLLGRYFISHARELAEHSARQRASAAESGPLPARYVSAGQGASMGRQVSRQEYTGLLLLAQLEHNYEFYLYGNTRVRAQSADSLYPADRNP